MTYLHCSYTAPTCVYILVFMRGCGSFVYLTASSTATATATVAPTMGLLPMPRKPIILSLIHI